MQAGEDGAWRAEAGLGEGGSMRRVAALEPGTGSTAWVVVLWVGRGNG